MGRRQYGTLRKLPSGRWQARYRDANGRLVTAPQTFATKADAGRYLDRVRTEMEKGTWIDPRSGATTFRDYAQRWIEERPALRPRTGELYEGLLRLHINPTFGDVALNRVTPAAVRTWHAKLTAAPHPGPSTVAKAYRLLRAVLATAVADELIAKNPCALRGAGVERPSERPVIAVETVLAIATAIEPRFRALVLLAAFGGLRLGELQGLRRRHLHLSTGTVRVVEQAQMLKDGSIVTGPPKSDAGVRTVTMPAVLVPALETHVRDWAAPGRDGLVFCGSSGQHFRRASFYKAWKRACAAAGVTDLHPHDLRHTGNTLAAALGASTKELMKRFGHSSARAALIYQHASRERDEAIAKGLDELIRGSLDPENAPDVARMWHADRPQPSEDADGDTGNVA